MGTGPFLLTGVALAAAGVAANPIVAQPAPTFRFPAVQLSAGTGDAAAMLDQAFLDAIAPLAPGVHQPVLGAAAADLIPGCRRTYLGKNAIVDAFVAGVTAVSQPELTASSTPYYPVAG